MRTKLAAVKGVNLIGVPALIVGGRTPGVLRRLWEGEPLGTWFDAQPTRLSSRKHWIAYALRPNGTLTVDDGAARALVEKGSSLLPIGVTRVDGDFEVGECVRIVDSHGQELARGLVAHAAELLRRALGLRGDRAAEALESATPEVVHRDDLVVLAAGMDG